MVIYNTFLHEEEEGAAVVHDGVGLVVGVHNPVVGLRPTVAVTNYRAGVYILASQKNSPPPPLKFIPVFVDFFAVI